MTRITDAYVRHQGGDELAGSNSAIIKPRLAISSIQHIDAAKPRINRTYANWNEIYHWNDKIAIDLLLSKMYSIWDWFDRGSTLN